MEHEKRDAAAIPFFNTSPRTLSSKFTTFPLEEGKVILESFLFIGAEALPFYY